MKLETYNIENYIQNSNSANYTTLSVGENKNIFANKQRNSFYQIVFIESGKAKYSIDFESYTINSPCVCFIFPNQIFSIEFSDDAKGQILMFDETIFCSEILKNELQEYNVDLHKRINYVDFSSNTKSFNEVLEIKKHIDILKLPLNNIRKIEAKFLIKIIIFKIIDFKSEDIVPVIKSRNLETYIEFRRLLDEEINNNRKVEYYSSKLNLSVKKLNIICKEFSNKSALEIIHERLTTEIKKVFLFEDLSLKEISFRLGFDSQPALNKFIFSKFGCTPSELKMKLLEK